LGRFADLALLTLEENNPIALAEMKRDGTLEAWLEAWVHDLKGAIAVRHEELWKAGDPMAAMMAESECVAEALGSPIFREPKDDLSEGLPIAGDSLGAVRRQRLKLLPIRAPTQEEWDDAMEARDAELLAKAPRDKDGNIVPVEMPPNDL